MQTDTVEEGIEENCSEWDSQKCAVDHKAWKLQGHAYEQDDMTIAELKGFPQSHQGEKKSTNIFHDLMCAKESEPDDRAETGNSVHCKRS